MKPADRARDEAGAYLILYAVLSVVFFATAALVLDITALRQDRAASRLAADAAAAAGAAQLDASGFGGRRACEQAWVYFLANNPDSDASISPPDCTPLSDPCDGTPRAPVVGSAGGLEVTIVNPVLVGDEMMLGESPGADRDQVSTVEHDGTDPCLRLGVSIRRTRDLSFAGIAGLRSAETDVHSVARPDEPQPTGRAPSLIVLDPTGCNALTTSDRATLRAQEKLADGSTVPGVITVDSDGSACGTGDYVIRPDPNGGGIYAGDAASPGVIRSYATFVDSPAKYDQGDTPARLWPTPSAAVRTGSGDVDAKYGTSIAALESDLGGSGPPAGFTDVYSGPCTLPLLALPITFTNNLYVDCDPFVVPAGASALFQDLGAGGSTTILFNGAVEVQGTQPLPGCLAVNSTCALLTTPPSRDATLYVRGGGFQKAAAADLSLPRTLLFVADGTVQLRGGQQTPDIRWTPPVELPFRYLSLWTPSTASVAIAAQSSGFNIEGLFFAPETDDFVLRPRPGQQNPPIDAQFIVKRFRLDGGSQPIQVGPDRTRAIQDTVRAVRLIR